MVVVTLFLVPFLASLAGACGLELRRAALAGRVILVTVDELSEFSELELDELLRLRAW